MIYFIYADLINIYILILIWMGGLKSMTTFVNVDKNKKNKLLKVLLKGNKVSEAVIYALLEVNTSELLKIIHVLNDEIRNINIIGEIVLDKSKCWLEIDQKSLDFEKLKQYSQSGKGFSNPISNTKMETTFLQKLINVKNSGSLNYNQIEELSERQYKLLKLIVFKNKVNMISICNILGLPKDLVFEELIILNNYLISKECGRVVKSEDDKYFYENNGVKFDILFKVIYQEDVKDIDIYNCNIFLDVMNLRIVEYISEAIVKFTENVLDDFNIDYGSLALRIGLINVILREKNIGEIKASSFTTKIIFYENGFEMLKKITNYFNNTNNLDMNCTKISQTFSEDNEMISEKSNNTVFEKSRYKYSGVDFFGLLEELMK